MKNILASLDFVANKLQRSGLNKYAEQVDIVTNTVTAAVGEEKELRVPLMELPPEIGKANKGEVIQQGFISEAPNCDVRIRKRGADYSLTAKFRPLNQEAEMEISKEMFETLWPTVIKPQNKTRYDYKGWEIDVMEDGSIVAEFEYTKEKSVNLPTHWKIRT